MNLYGKMIELLFKKHKYDLSRPTYWKCTVKSNSVIETLCGEVRSVKQEVTYANFGKTKKDKSII